MRLSIFQGFDRNPCIVFPPDTAEPIRSELFSAERLEQHAETLAAAQRVTALRRADRRLAKRLADNGRVLLEAYRGVEQAVRDERPITPADEWLLDNFYLAQQQIRQSQGSTEDVYKLYAESFKDREHLARIQDEAQALVARVFAQRSNPPPTAAGGS